MVPRATDGEPAVTPVATNDPASVLETAARVVQLAGSLAAAEVASLRAAFEARTGSFAPDDPWFEERIRAFWGDAVTAGQLGRRVEASLEPEHRRWLGPLGRAHRGLFRAGEEGASSATGATLVDVWSGVELELDGMDEASRQELDAASGQLFDARVVSTLEPFTVVLLPGAVFHPRDATPSILTVLAAARSRRMTTIDTLDALLRMHRALRSLSRVKVAYAYRPEALSPQATVLPHVARRAAQGR